MLNDGFITKPIQNLDQLFNWIPTDITKRKISFVKLRHNTSANIKTKTMICHDIRGGYIDDKYDQGSNLFNTFYLWHWKYFDLFIYFSHDLISIPPFVCRVAAHLNNVPILANFCFEGDAQLAKLHTIFSPEKSPLVISQLVSLAVENQFDGYFLNFETEINVSLVPGLMDFVNNLRIALETAIPRGTVVWFDAINVDGRLIYHRTLNQNNYIFLNKATAFLTDYSWDENQIHKCLEYSTTETLPNCYAGVDFFNREYIPKERFVDKCVQRVKYVRNINMSVGLFAISYIYEVFPYNEFYDRYSKLWNLLKPYLVEHIICWYPFKTNFCVGRGKCKYFLGNVVSKESFTNLSIQQLQPNFEKHFDDTNKNLKGIEEISCGICFDVSYTGGSSYKLSLELSPISQVYSLSYLKYNLFNFDFEIKETIIIGLTYLFSNQESTVCVVLELEFSDLSKTRILLKDNISSDRIEVLLKNSYKNTNILTLAEDIYLVTAFQSGLGSKNKWRNQYSVIHEDLIPKGNLKAVNLLLITDETIRSSSLDIWFGQFFICPYSSLDVDWKEFIISNIVASDMKIEHDHGLALAAILKYDIPKYKYDEIDSIDIFYMSNEIKPNYSFIGESLMVGAYSLKMKLLEDPLPSDLILVLQVVLKSGIRMPIDRCSSITLHLS